MLLLSIFFSILCLTPSFVQGKWSGKWFSMFKRREYFSSDGVDRPFHGFCKGHPKHLHFTIGDPIIVRSTSALVGVVKPLRKYIKAFAHFIPKLGRGISHHSTEIYVSNPGNEENPNPCIVTLGITAPEIKQGIDPVTYVQSNDQMDIVNHPSLFTYLLISLILSSLFSSLLLFSLLSFLFSSLLF